MTTADMSGVYSLLAGLANAGTTAYGTGYGTNYGTLNYGNNLYGTAAYNTGYGMQNSNLLSSIDNYGTSAGGFSSVFSNLSSTLNMADYMINTGGYINTSQSSTTKQMQAQGMQRAMETSNLRAQYYKNGYTKAQVDDILGIGDGSSGITAANAGGNDMSMLLCMALLPQLMGGDGESSLDPTMLATLFASMGGTGGMTNSNDAALLSMLGLSSGTTGSTDLSSVLSLFGLA